MRAALLLVVLVAGCLQPIDDHPALTAELAVEAASAAVKHRSAPPAPKPSGDVCPRCEGRGVLGDGAAIRETCPDCRGTGKRLKSVLCPSGDCKAVPQ